MLPAGQRCCYKTAPCPVTEVRSLLRGPHHRTTWRPFGEDSHRNVNPYSFKREAQSLRKSRFRVQIKMPVRAYSFERRGDGRIVSSGSSKRLLREPPSCLL